MSVPSASSKSVRALTLVVGLAAVSLGYHALVERAIAWAATADAGRARALAGAGLEASLRAVSVGQEGALGSPQDPVFFERGSLCVAATRTGPRELRLVATATVGISRARAEFVVEPGAGQSPEVPSRHFGFGKPPRRASSSSRRATDG